MLESTSQDLGATYYPDLLNVFIGMKCVFKLHVDEYNIRNKYHVYTVIRMSDDADIMQRVMEAHIAKRGSMPFAGKKTIEDINPKTPNKASAEIKPSPDTNLAGSSHSKSSKRSLILDDEEE